MTMKTMLAPIHKDGQPNAVLQTALAFARRYGSHIEGVPLDLMRTEFVAADIYGATLVPVPASVREKSVLESREAFDQFMRRHAVATADVNSSGPTQAWNEIDVSAMGGIESYARAFDLSVYARPQRAEFAPHRGVLEATLFDSGRPMLIAAPGEPTSIGDNLVIAWNCSTESARTVGFAMPLLAEARQVTVLTVTGGTVPGPSGAELVRRLRSNGIDAAERTVPDNGRGIGQTILAEATALGCDLLIKGAYTQSRLRQMIFGGATSHILTHAEMPVFMAN